MVVDFDLIKEKLFVSPLLVLKECLENKEVLDYCNSLIPYSVGIEMEYDLLQENIKHTSSIDFYCLDKQFWSNEQTFRIPNGYKGLLCLELVSLYLKKYQTNTNSGNHYHIDCTENYLEVFKAIKKEKEFVLSELETWGTNDIINKKEIGQDTKFTYCNLRSHFKTAEFRIGELTCEFPLLLNRILSCTDIIKTVRQRHNLEYDIVYDNIINKQYILNQIEINDNQYIDFINKEKIELINKRKQDRKELKESIGELPNKQFLNNKVIKFY